MDAVGRTAVVAVDPGLVAGLAGRLVARHAGVVDVVERAGRRRRQQRCLRLDVELDHERVARIELGDDIGPHQRTDGAAGGIGQRAEPATGVDLRGTGLVEPAGRQHVVDVDVEGRHRAVVEHLEPPAEVLAHPGVGRIHAGGRGLLDHQIGEPDGERVDVSRDRVAGAAVLRHVGAVGGGGPFGRGQAEVAGDIGGVDEVLVVGEVGRRADHDVVGEGDGTAGRGDRAGHRPGEGAGSGPVEDRRGRPGEVERHAGALGRQRVDHGQIVGVAVAVVGDGHREAVGRADLGVARVGVGGRLTGRRTRIEHLHVLVDDQQRLDDVDGLRLRTDRLVPRLPVEIADLVGGDHDLVGLVPHHGGRVVARRRGRGREVDMGRVRQRDPALGAVGEHVAEIPAGGLAVGGEGDDVAGDERTTADPLALGPADDRRAVAVELEERGQRVERGHVEGPVVGRHRHGDLEVDRLAHRVGGRVGVGQVERVAVERRDVLGQRGERELDGVGVGVGIGGAFVRPGAVGRSALGRHRARVGELGARHRRVVDRDRVADRDRPADRERGEGRDLGLGPGDGPLGAGRYAGSEHPAVGVVGGHAGRERHAVGQHVGDDQVVGRRRAPRADVGVRHHERVGDGVAGLDVAEAVGRRVGVGAVVGLRDRGVRFVDDGGDLRGGHRGDRSAAARLPRDPDPVADRVAHVDRRRVVDDHREGERHEVVEGADRVVPRGREGDGDIVGGDVDEHVAGVLGGGAVDVEVGVGGRRDGQRDGGRAVVEAETPGVEAHEVDLAVEVVGDHGVVEIDPLGDRHVEGVGDLLADRRLLGGGRRRGVGAVGAAPVGVARGLDLGHGHVGDHDRGLVARARRVLRGLVVLVDVAGRDVGRGRARVAVAAGVVADAGVVHQVLPGRDRRRHGDRVRQGARLLRREVGDRHREHAATVGGLTPQRVAPVARVETGDGLTGREGGGGGDVGADDAGREDVPGADVEGRRVEILGRVGARLEVVRDVDLVVEHVELHPALRTVVGRLPGRGVALVEHDVGFHVRVAGLVATREGHPTAVVVVLEGQLGEVVDDVDTGDVAGIVGQPDREDHLEPIGGVVDVEVGAAAGDRAAERPAQRLVGRAARRGARAGHEVVGLVDHGVVHREHLTGRGVVTPEGLEDRIRRDEVGDDRVAEVEVADELDDDPVAHPIAGPVGPVRLVGGGRHLGGERGRVAVEGDPGRGRLRHALVDVDDARRLARGRRVGGGLGRAVEIDRAVSDRARGAGDVDLVGERVGPDDRGVVGERLLVVDPHPRGEGDLVVVVDGEVGDRRPHERPGAVGVLGDRVGIVDATVDQRRRETAGLQALGTDRRNGLRVARREDRALAVGERVGHDDAGGVAVLTGLQQQVPTGQLGLGELPVVDGLVDREVLRGDLPRILGGRGQVVDPRVVVARGPGPVAQRLLVGRQRTRVVVEIRGVVADVDMAGRERRGVLPQRDAGRVHELEPLAGRHRADGRGQVPDDVRVDPGGLARELLVGGQGHRLDEGRGLTGGDDAVARRVDGGDTDAERTGARILLRAAGRHVGHGHGIGVVDGAAAEELEPGGQVVLHHDRIRGIDQVVVDRQAVGRPLGVDPPQELGLGIRLELLQVDRLDAGDDRVGVEGRGVAVVDVGARGIEVGDLPDVARHVGAARVRHRRADRERCLGEIDGDRDRPRDPGLEVGDVLEQEGRLAGTGSVGDDPRVACARGDEGRAGWEDLAERQVVAVATTAVVGGGERVGDVLAVEDRPRTRLGEVERGIVGGGRRIRGRGEVDDGQRDREERHEDEQRRRSEGGTVRHRSKVSAHADTPVHARTDASRRACSGCLTPLWRVTRASRCCSRRTRSGPRGWRWRACAARCPG